LAPCGDGRMWFDRRFESDLATNGLTRFERVMQTDGGECLRVLDDRENWRLMLEGMGQLSRRAYLKRHHVRTWGSRFRAGLGLGPGETAGRVEARNIRLLRADGITSMRLIGYGEQLHADGLVESFVMTEALEAHLPLDDFLRRRFPARTRHFSESADPDLRQLIRQVAGVVRRFHAAGYNHRDLYCCHLFVRETEPGRFEIRLIDLQRVQRRRWFRRRWLVKDLAQLAYSAPQSLINRTHRLAFIRRYLGVRKLRPVDKRLIRRVLAKQRRLERKHGVIA